MRRGQRKEKEKRKEEEEVRHGGGKYLDVIHRGNITQGQKLIEPYLARDTNVSGSHYEQGGSLYALGLIYANHGTHVLDYLLKQFQNTQEEVIQHGGALGLGVAGMGTGSEEIFEALSLC